MGYNDNYFKCIIIFFTVFLMSSDYILPGYMIVDLFILENWKEVMLDLKFYLFVLVSSTICYFIEICSYRYPSLFFNEEKYYYNFRRDELKYIENNNDFNNEATSIIESNENN